MGQNLPETQLRHPVSGLAAAHGSQGRPVQGTRLQRPDSPNRRSYTSRASTARMRTTGASFIRRRPRLLLSTIAISIQASPHIPRNTLWPTSLRQAAVSVGVEELCAVVARAAPESPDVLCRHRKPPQVQEGTSAMAQGAGRARSVEGRAPGCCDRCQRRAVTQRSR